MPDSISIEKHPAIIDKKPRIGDWGSDAIIGKDQQNTLLTLAKRVTRYTIICKLKNFKAKILPMLLGYIKLGSILSLWITAKNFTGTPK